MSLKVLRAALAALAIAFAWTGPAWAWHSTGHIVCAGTGLPLAGIPVSVTGTGSTSFSGSTTTDSTGYYFIPLPNAPGTYSESLDLSSLGRGSTSSPESPVAFSLDNTIDVIVIDFTVTSDTCTAQACWLTGGGIAPPDSSFGGNVNPGCSPTAGQGGNWNQVDHVTSLHFQGTAITVDRCGNVDGIPPGAKAPATNVNFIEFHGTGRLQGVAGNKADYESVCFKGRAEDRGEPGSGQNARPPAPDRYFLRVTDCKGTTLMETSAAPGTDTPVSILHGNLQIHTSGCGK
jgi:hypothetical protein